MKKRKAAAFILILSLILSSFSVSFAATGTETVDTASAAFADMAGHWSAAAVSKWAGYGIINGFNGMFRPDDPITRGEMAVILDNMMDYQKVAENTFSDLRAGKFYTESVLKANAAGTIKGNAGKVRPNDKITKEEAAVMLCRALAVETTSESKGFRDAGQVSSWAKSAVFGMEAKGYVSGYGGYFKPKSNITRAEAVTMIDNIVKAYYTKAGTYTEPVDGTAIIKVSDVILKGVAITGNLIIAEGVGQGDATLDGVSIKGDTVIRGGGEHSIHITGNSTVAKITIEKAGDKLRVVIADGTNVREMEVASGEEIILSGSIGTVEVNASDAKLYAEAAVIKSAIIAGENSHLVVGAQSTLENISVASTGEKAKVETQAGGIVKAVIASAEVEISGKGIVTKVTLNEGADGSKVTTPNTSMTVSAGVNGVTGAGGTAAPSGSTVVNDATGASSSVTKNGATTSGNGSSGGNGGGGNNEPSAEKTQLTVSEPNLAISKPYDGTTSAAVTAGALNGVSGTDSVTVSAEAYYDTAAIGTGKTMTVVYSIGGTDSSKYIKPVNYTVSTGAITKKSLTISAPTLTTTKGYDGTTAAAVTPGTLSGVAQGETVTVSAIASYDTAEIGTGKTITVLYTLGGANVGYYTAPADYTTTSGIISAAVLTVSGTTVESGKVYDGTTATAVTAGALTGVASGDTVTVSAKAYYDTKDVGTGKTITVEYTLDGADAGKYAAPASYTTTGTITAKTLTIGNPTVQSEKAYNGTTAAAVTAGALSGVAVGDTVTVHAAAAYDTKTIGTNKTITVSYSLVGKDAANYTAPAAFTATGSITKAALTIYAPTLATTKGYDGTTAAAVTPGALSGVAEGETVTVSATASYDTAAIDDWKTITVVYTLGGADAGNYTAPADYTTTSGIITAAILTVSGTTVDTEKIYDGKTTAAVTAGALTGVASGDAVTVSAKAYYDTKDAGTEKTITVEYVLDGADAGKYADPDSYTISAGVITAKALTIGDPTIQGEKAYDGTTVAAVTAGALIGVIAGDKVSVKASANYAAAGQGTNIGITVQYSLEGADAANYIAPTSYAAIGSITKPVLTISVPTLATKKVYDGTTAAAVTPGALSGVAAGETVTVSAIASYDTAKAGTGKTITVVYTLGGTDAGKYTTPAEYTTTSGIITQAALTISGTTVDSDKIYDGTRSAVVTIGAISGIISGDDVSVSLDASYDSKTAGNDKFITGDYIITGEDAENYVIPESLTTPGSIQKVKLQIEDPSVALTKIYDGTTAAAVTAGALIGVIDGDTVSVNASANYAAASTGTGIGITVKYTLEGTDAENYDAPDDFITAGDIKEGPAPTPSAFKLEAGSSNKANVANAIAAIPAPGGSNSEGKITGWSTGTDTIKFTVDDTDGATSSIKINDEDYTEGSDYQIESAGTLVIEVTTSKEGYSPCVRTFNVTVEEAVKAKLESVDFACNTDSDTDDTLTLWFDTEMSNVGEDIDYIVEFSFDDSFSEGDTVTLNSDNGSFQAINGSSNIAIITLSPAGHNKIVQSINALEEWVTDRTGYIRVTVSNPDKLAPKVDPSYNSAITGGVGY